MRFSEVNTRAAALEAENARLQAQLAGHQQTVTTQMQDQAAKFGAERQLHVALARAGVTSDAYAVYLAQQYQGLGQQAPPVEAWVNTQRAALPAFFAGMPGSATPPAPPPSGGPPPVTPPAAPPPAPPPGAPPPAAPRGNPDAGAGGAGGSPPMQDPPLTMALIDTMDTATYARRRAEIRKFMAEQRR